MQLVGNINRTEAVTSKAREAGFVSRVDSSARAPAGMRRQNNTILLRAARATRLLSMLL